MERSGAAQRWVDHRHKKAPHGRDHAVKALNHHRLQEEPEV
jgi:hypothetical protein